MPCGILTGDVFASAGIEQGEEMKRFLWDNHFAAVASDMPSLERWPTPEGVPHLHQTLLGYVRTRAYAVASTYPGQALTARTTT